MKVKLSITKKEALGIARRFEENIDGIIIHPETEDEDFVSLFLKDITETGIDGHHALFRTGDNDRAVIITNMSEVYSVEVLKDEVTE